MNIVLITQDEPFYLAEQLKYLFNNFPEHSRITGCVVLSPSPFGKRKTFLQKANETRKIFGNGFFAYYSFQYILSKLNPKKSVTKLLKDNNIPAIYLEKSINNKSSLELIKNHKPDLLISILGNEIFKKPIIELAPKGCLNLHTALLPKYRGLMPTFWVLKNNEKQTGVSVFFIDEGIDSGPILVQKKMEINDQTQVQLIRETKKLGMEAIIESLEKIYTGKFELILNKDEDSTYFSLPNTKDVKEFLKNGKRFY